jgi:hypothetical protein
MTVLKAFYDVKVVQGAQQNIYDAVDCTSGTCTIDNIVATLTVNFPGISGVHTYVKTNDSIANSFTGGDVTNRTYQNNSTTMTVLKGVYDVKVVQGAQQNIYDAVDCTSGTCTITSIVATLTVKFPGMSGVHTYVKTNDGVAGTATGGDVDNRTYKNDKAELVVLKNIYDVVLVLGGKTYIWDAVDCRGETCTLDKSNLTVNFPGISSVHTYVKKSDGKAGQATGQQVAAQTYKNDQAVFANLPNGIYDVVVVKNAETKIIDDVVVLGSNVTVDNIVATLTVKFPGISSVHTYVKVDDGVVGSAGGGDVDNRTYKNDEASLVVLKNTYDVVVVKNAKQKIIDAVNCNGDTCLVDGIVATLTVKFPGISSVHTYVKVDDTVVGTAGGGDVDNRTYKNDEASLVVLKNTYDVVVVKNAKTKIIDAVNCTGDTCTVDGIVATLTVKFPGISSVHTYVKVNDGVAGTAVGGDVDNRTYKNEETSLVVLKNTYDVVVVKNAKQKIIDAVDCTGDTCTVDGIVATLTVKFPGITSVHTYVKVDDGAVGTASGGDVDNRTYKNNEASLAVLKNTYDVVVVKNAKTKIIDAVDCTGDLCEVSGIVATLTVKFPGISSVHTYVKVNDGVAGTAAGGDVDNRTYKNEETSLVVLKNTYDVVVVKNAKQKIIDAVDCTGDTCLVDNIVAMLTVKFPGISSVHTYVKVNDGVAGTATGGDVDNRTYKNDETSLAVLKNTYDVVVVKNAKQKIMDAVDCTGPTCTVDNIVATLKVNFPGSSGVHVYVKTDDGLPNSAKGGDVDNRTYQNNSTSLVVLKNTYDVVVVSGATTTILDAVNCYGSTCEKSLITIKLLNSTGSGLSGGAARYYDGSWHEIGTTDSSGVIRTGIDGAPRNLLFSMDYAFTHNEKWQNIATNALVVFQTKKVEVQLKNSLGALFDTGAVKYYTGAWHDLGNTSGGKVTVELLPANILFSMDNAYVHNETWQDVGSNPTVLFQTKNVEVQLKNSADALFDTGAVKYYTGAWHDLGNTSGGKVNVELLPANILFSMDNNFVHNEKWQDVGSNPTVVFQTKKVEVQLKNSADALFDTGTVKYYTGAWHDLGTTSGGKVNVELLPANILFSMDNNFVHNEKWQDVGSNPTVVFQTKKVEVQLKNSADALFDTGTVKYYTGAWHDFGTTSSGQVSMELLPANILFSMDYAFTHNEKWQNVGTNPTVVFQTGQVKSGTGTCTQYYTGSWHAFTNDMELLPASILFHFNDGAGDAWFTPVAGTINDIH